MPPEQRYGRTEMTMTSCCEDKACEVSALRESHGRVLWIVLGINTLMFVM